MGLQIGDIVPRQAITLEGLKGKFIVIDAFNSIYQFLSSIRQPDGTPLMDSKKRVTSHLSGLFYRNINLLQEGIKLIYVFDGTPPEQKGRTHELRQEAKDEAREKYEQAKQEEDIESMGKYSKALSRLNQEMIDESKELLKALGICVIQAPGEGEAEAAFLAREYKEIYAVGSQDYDSLLFGAPRLIQNLTLARKRKTFSGFVYISPEIIELEKVLNSLQINMEQLISLGILVGSVDYNEQTIFKENGIIKMSRIGECPTDLPLEVPCFDALTKKITFKKVKKYIKHKINEPLYEVLTRYNRKVRVTKSHSLFIKRDNKILAIKTPELKIGDKLVVPIKIPTQNKEILELNLAQELWKHRDKLKRLIYCDGRNVQSIIKSRLLQINDKRNTDKRYVLTKFGLKKLISLRIDKKITTTKTPLSSSILYDWEKGKRDPTENRFKNYLNFLGIDLKEFNKGNKCIKEIKKSVFEENIFPLIKYQNKYRKTLLFKSLSEEEIKLLSEQDFIYGRTRSKNPLSSIIKITPELIKIIGYFLAEGHLSKDYRVNFSFAHKGIGHDDYCVKDAVRCIRKVFKTIPKVYTEKSVRHICIDNCVVHDFFAYVLGLEKQNSKTKKVPNLIFNINPELQLELLKGLFLGDGSLSKDHISFNTASTDLATGLSYIFLQQGIISSTTSQTERNYSMKALNICGKDQLLKSKKIWEKHSKAKRLIEYCKKISKKKPLMEIEGDLGYIKIKAINKVKPSNAYVYDFSVDGENFIAGFGGVCCHNTDYNPGGVHGLGPKKSLDIVRKLKSPAVIFNSIPKEKQDFDWQEIYSLFHKPNVTRDVDISCPRIDEDKVRRILVEEHDFSLERVNSALDKLKVAKKEQSQKTLF